MTSEMLREFTQKIIEDGRLSEKEAEEALVEIMIRGSDAQIASFLTAIYLKGITPEEIAGFAHGMKKLCVKIRPKVRKLVDTCGTGGDGLSTINISTASAILVSACGVPVAKHGNYSFTSKCGSADVLKALGVKIDLEPETVEKSIEQIGIGFMLAPQFHKSMKRVAHIRKELGFRTIFNILGPLTNPANANIHLMGVYSEGYVCLLA